MRLQLWKDIASEQQASYSNSNSFKTQTPQICAECGVGCYASPLQGVERCLEYTPGWRAASTAYLSSPSLRACLLSAHTNTWYTSCHVAMRAHCISQVLSRGYLLADWAAQATSLPSPATYKKQTQLRSNALRSPEGSRSRTRQIVENSEQACLRKQT